MNYSYRYIYEGPSSCWHGYLANASSIPCTRICCIIFIMIFIMNIARSACDVSGLCCSDDVSELSNRCCIIMDVHAMIRVSAGEICTRAADMRADAACRFRGHCDGDLALKASPRPAYLLQCTASQCRSDALFFQCTWTACVQAA